MAGERRRENPRGVGMWTWAAVRSVTGSLVSVLRNQCSVASAGGDRPEAAEVFAASVFTIESKNEEKSICVLNLFQYLSALEDYRVGMPGFGTLLLLGPNYVLAS